jgi:hypothetical protein
MVMGQSNPIASEFRANSSGWGLARIAKINQYSADLRKLLSVGEPLHCE